MQTPPFIPVFHAVVSEDLDVITQSFIHAVNNLIHHCDRCSIMKFGTDKSFTIFCPETNKGRRSTRSRPGPVKSFMIFRPSAQSMAQNLIYRVHAYIPKHTFIGLHTYMHT